MKTISKKKKVLYVFISAVIIFLGVSIITDTPPLVIINGKLHFVFSKELNLFYYDEIGRAHV